MSNTADKLLAHTRSRTTKHHLVGVVEPDGANPGRFTVDFALKVSNDQAEIAALELLAIVQENAAEGASCCAECASRLTRVTQAMAALTTAPGVIFIKQEPVH